MNYLYIKYLSLLVFLSFFASQALAESIPWEESMENGLYNANKVKQDVIVVFSSPT